MTPDCGSPQRTQRYAEGWATAAEEMAGLDPELLLPGHGEPLLGSATVTACLLDIAEFLRSIVAQALAALNDGKTHEEIASSVRTPPHLADRPYLQPVYDRPEFIARNVVRMYGGWWDGHPANLMPAPASDRARAIVEIAGGIDRLVAHARQVATSDVRLACHLAEWAMEADPSGVSANECARDIFRMRQDSETSLHVRAICGHAIRKAEAALRAAGVEPL
jgi:alkyl sulfatase BDS1-like metallo-beta-lactamase superfamily hydrolase